MDFGATDAPMTDQQLAEARGGPTLHITTCLGAVVPTYNLPGVTAAAALHRPRPGGHLPGEDQDLERPGASPPSIPGSPFPTRRSPPSTARTARAPPSPSSTTSPRSARSGSSASAPPPRSAGRAGSAGRATRAWPARCARTRTPSATSSWPTPCRIAWASVWCRTRPGPTPSRPSPPSPTPPPGALATMPDDLRVSITDAEGEQLLAHLHLHLDPGLPPAARPGQGADPGQLPLLGHHRGAEVRQRPLLRPAARRHPAPGLLQDRGDQLQRPAPAQPGQRPAGTAPARWSTRWTTGTGRPPPTTRTGRARPTLWASQRGAPGRGPRRGVGVAGGRRRACALFLVRPRRCSRPRGARRSPWAGPPGRPRPASG